eukprot:666943-Hanusia_phi.AAC.10
MDIGGGLFVADLRSLSDGSTDNLLPACMPLAPPRLVDGSPDLYGRDACANNQTMSWLASYLVDSRADYSLNEADLGSTSVDTQAPWDCPVRELHFWSGLDAAFQPSAPYGPRAGAMFFETSNMGGTVGNGMSNPMQVYGQSIASLRPAAFVSEVCSCSSAADCSFVASHTSGGCSIVETVDFLSGGVWKERQAYAGSRGCKTSLDWPHAGGTLRDGTNLGYSASGECPAHDRLRRFELRYMPVSITEDAGQTTLDPGGECHMGKLVRVPASVPHGGQCRRFNYSHLQCSVTIGVGLAGTPSTVVSYHALDVPTSTPYARQVADPANHRRRCSRCDPPPLTKRFYDRSNGQQQTAAYIDNHYTSFGVPVRLSLARMLARDLRQQACGNQASCPLLDAVANRAEWTVDRFMASYLRDIANLFTSGGTATGTVPPPPPPVNDSALWERDWAYCTETSRNMTTGAYTRRCFGSVPKEEWVDPARRAGACRAAILDNTPTRAAMIPIRICTLDSQMNELCTRVADFLQRIQQASCKAAGVCVETEFLYNPAAYSISNQEFVTQTVLNFYQSVDAQACSASQTAAEIAAVIAQNNDMKAHCPAEWLVPVQQLISKLRTIVQILVKLAYYVVMMVVNFLRLLTGESSSQVMPSVFQWLNMFINEAKVLFDQIGNMIFGVIQATPFGGQLMTVVRLICTLLNWFIMYFFLPVVCPIIKLFGEYWVFIGNLLSGIANACLLGVCPFKWIPYQIFLNIGSKMAGMDCTPRSVLNCTIGDNYNAASGAGTLPTPTRCWASYITSLSSAGGQMSCAASDTCLRTETSGNSDTVVCDACPFGQDVNSVNRFGCDPIRKQCLCNVPQTLQTPCMTHEQCINQVDATCAFMNSEIQPTFGNIPCAQCTSEPMCVIEPGQTYGTCSCFLTRVTPQACSSSEVGQQVAYKLSGLCLAQATSSMGGYTAASSSTYTISYANLLATPCYNADASNIYCYSVYSSAFSFTPMLVSLGVGGVLASGGSSPYGRRLLSEEGAPDFYSLDDACMDAWDAFVESNRSTRVLATCATRFAATWDVAGEFGVRDYVPPNMFVSWADFLGTAGERPEALLVALWNPSFLFALAARTPLFLRLRRYHSAWTRAFGDLYLDLVVLRTPQINGSLRYEIDVDGGVFINGNNISEVTLILLNLLHRARDFAWRNDSDFPLSASNRDSMMAVRGFLADGPLASALLYNGSGVEEPFEGSAAARRLLQSTWREQMQEVQRFTGSVALNSGVPQAVGAATDNAWVNSPFAWPLRFDFGGTAFQCPLLSRSLQLAVDAFTNTSLYYTQGPALAAKPRAVVSGSWPLSNLPYRGPVPPLQPPADSSLPNLLVHQVVSWLDRTPFSRQFFYDLFGAMPVELRSLFQCDRQAVMLCTRHRYTLLVSGFVIGVIWAGLATAASAFGIPYAQAALWVLYPPVVVYYAFGVSPLCLPMIPTCLFSDLVDALNFLFPAKLAFPDSLQAYPGCLDFANATNRSACIVPCSRYPFEYTSWEPELAWWSCMVSTGACKQAMGYLPSLPLLNKMTSLHRHLAVKAALLDGGNSDMIIAQSVCATFNLWRLIPVALIVSVTLYFISVIASFPFFLLSELLRLTIQAVIATHTE